MKDSYLEAIKLIERLHRQFLEVVKTELDRNGIEDINNVQALILFNIGSDELTVGELTNRGYYLGSNVSYNVRKMVENGYLIACAHWFARLGRSRAQALLGTLDGPED